MFDWIVTTLDQAGPLGIAGLMFLENLFPPIPSELVMPLAGFLVAQGRIGLIAALLAGLIGTLIGAAMWYYIGRWLGAERLRSLCRRHGRWIGLSPEDVDRARGWFQRHGPAAMFLGRMVPGVRTLISVPAGMAHMPLLPFLLYTGAGSLIWIGALTAAGFLLEANYSLVAGWMDPISKVVIGLFVLAYLWRVITWRHR